MTITINSITTPNGYSVREKKLNFWIQYWKYPKAIKLKEVGHFPQEELPQYDDRAVTSNH